MWPCGSLVEQTVYQSGSTGKFKIKYLVYTTATVEDDIPTKMYWHTFPSFKFS